MPYEIKHISPNKFQVKNRITGQIHSRGTTLEKALSQKKILDFLDLKNQYRKN